MPEWIEVRSQAELDAALARPETIPVCLGEGEFAVGGDAVVKAGDLVAVIAGDRSTVEAWGDARVEASDSATVAAWASVYVAARGSATVEAWNNARVIASDSVAVRLWGRAEADVRDSVRVDADHWTRVTAHGDARVHAFGFAMVVASGGAAVKAWDQARVNARDTVVVEAWGSSTVDAAGSATVRASGSAFVKARGDASVTALGSTIVSVEGAATVNAAGHVPIRRVGHASKVTGGVVAQAPPIETAEDWCAHYGVDVEDGVATLYKAVDREFVSGYGMSYAPGTQPEALDWDGGEQDCGGGLHFSPSPSFALEFERRAERFVACPVRVEDIIVSRTPRFQHKVKARAVCAPVYEVDESGSPV